jgi:hypothetical protein
MAISPFSARPASPGSDRSRARLALAIAMVGIAATLLAYAISPGVRHAVGHAAHSVNHAVSHVFDPDNAAHATPSHPTQRLHLVQPLKHTQHTRAGAGARAPRTHKAAA